jgi:hypothetical protein
VYYCAAAAAVDCENDDFVAVLVFVVAVFAIFVDTSM